MNAPMMSDATLASISLAIASIGVAQPFTTICAFTNRVLSDAGERSMGAGAAPSKSVGSSLRTVDRPALGIGGAEAETGNGAVTD